MALYGYIIHPLAAKDYHDAVLWYEEQQTGLGEKFILAVRNKIDLILSTPQAYSSKNRKLFREVSIDNFPFVIVYKTQRLNNRIYIVAIHHTKRNPKGRYRKKDTYQITGS